MSNPAHLAVLKRGAEVWNAWRLENPEIRPDLRGAYVSESSMDWAIDHLGPPLFENAPLAGINLTGARLDYVILSGANLSSATFSRSNLIGADLRGADARRADLTNTKLNQANLTLANLASADFRGALFWETVLARTNLTDARGLDLCRHGGPSIIDHRTIRKSGNLPRVFLQGCGLPDSLIDYLPSLLTDPFQFASVFISYSTKDDAFAKKLHRSLQRSGVRCWFAPQNVRGGHKLHEQIDEAIRVYDRLLLVLSEHSMSSEWVKTEIAHARQKELNEKRQVLFPISLASFAKIREWKNFDADTGKDSAREVREYFIPDFSNWTDDDAYKKAFHRLVRDLKAEEKRRPPDDRN